MTTIYTQHPLDFQKFSKMKQLIFVSALIAMVALTQGFSFLKFMNRRDPFPEPENPPAPKNTVEGNITQQLDHFDLTNDATWTQRYLMNGANFQPGGVIFVFLAGEWEITPYRLENSLMVLCSTNKMCKTFFVIIFSIPIFQGSIGRRTEWLYVLS